MPDFSKHMYPLEESIANLDEGERFLPPSLSKFWQEIISEIKRNSIGQGIIYAARPKYALMSILFELGVELDHMLGSPWLIEP